MTLLKRLFLTSVWVLIGVSLAGFAAAYVRPAAYWPLAIIAVFLPGFCVLLTISLLFTAALRKWLPFGLALVIVLLVVHRHTAIQRLFRPSEGEADLTVMSYNAPKEPDNEDARRQVTALVKRERPDVIALQESVVWSLKARPYVLSTHRKLQPLVDSLRYVASMPPLGGPPDVRWTHWKPPVLLRIPPDRQDQLEVGGKGTHWPTFDVLRTEVTWRDRKLALYNIHLTSHGAGKPWQRPGGILSTKAWADYLAEVRAGFKVREWQVDQVSEWLAGEKLPVVLVGDFNSTPDSWSYHRLTRGLQDAHRISGSWLGATYHSSHPMVRIDFVLLGPEFEAVNSYVAKPYPTTSDHRPLIARFRWRDETN